MSWEQARQKIHEGREWTDTVSVPFGDETIPLTYQLLPETTLWEIERAMDKGELENADVEMGDTEQRIQELSTKDNLTAAEEEELRELGMEVQAKQADVLDSMGEDGFAAIMEAGKEALTPSSADIDAAFDTPSTEQERRFNFVPTTRDEMREALELEMQTEVEEQPYPIKFIVGQAAYAESMSLLGSTDIDSGNPTRDE